LFTFDTLKYESISKSHSFGEKYMIIKTIKNSYQKTLLILVAVVVLAVAVIMASVIPVLAFSPEYTAWQQYPSNPVFDPAESVYYPCIIFDGATYYMWYDGTQTRFSISPDGINWAPGISVTGLTDPRHAVVKWLGSSYRIWYWDSNGIYYSINDIRTAVSNDGINWTSDTVISQVGTTVITGNAGFDWNASSYGPCEVFYNPGGSGTIVAPVDAATVWQNKFVMYYDGTTGGYEDIGIAVSADGVTWQGYNGGAAPVLAHSGSGWDSNYATFCTIQQIAGVYHMWYSGGQTASNEGIGYAQSLDGISWTKYGSNPIMHKTDGVVWRSARTYTPRVLYDSANFSGAGEAYQLKMWYNGTASGNYVLGYARMLTASPPPTTTPPTTTPPTTTANTTIVTAVGGTVNPVDKMGILMPYILTFITISTIVVVSWLTWRKQAIEKLDDRKN